MASNEGKIMNIIPIERRRHVVYVTRHTEYHCHSRECVGVRDRRSGEWKRRHTAIRSRLMGSINARGSLSAMPCLGHRLIFAGSKSIITSRIECAARPAKDVIWAYTSLCTSGMIGA